MSDGTVQSAPAGARNVAIDAYRGLVMLLMMGEVLQFAHVAHSFPENPVWQFLGYQQSHTEWVGMSLHDTIQPGFTFLAGVSLAYSLASRRRKGESFKHMLFHVKFGVAPAPHRAGNLSALDRWTHHLFHV